MRIIFFILFICAQACFAQEAASPLNKIEKPIICGHRGGFYSAFPENSLSVINYVKGQLSDQPLFLEIDIRRSKDGTLYILHDESVDRTTNGTGYIKDLTDVYIEQLFLKSASGKLSEERVLKFTELLDELKDSKILLMLDIKSNVWIETAELILKKGCASRSLFLTFKPEDTSLLNRLSDQLFISVLIRNEEDWLKIKSYSILPQNLVAYVLRDAKVDLIDQLKTSGLKIMADVSEHTTNQGLLYKEEYYQKRLVDQKLDILITDFPIEVSKMIENGH